jgi:class I fructose-bisphosphate aldolase
VVTTRPGHCRTVALVRQAAEFGADIVKADPRGNLQEHFKMIQTAAPKPVLPRGGSRASDSEILSRTQALTQLGASGAVYGRSVYQRPHVERMVRACMAILHEGASVAKAMSTLRGISSTRGGSIGPRLGVKSKPSRRSSP